MFKCRCWKKLCKTKKKREKIPLIIPYRGFGNTSYIYIKGAVFKDFSQIPPEEDDSIFKNIRRMIKRFTTKPLKNMKVKVRFYSKEMELTTDKTGIFETKMDILGLNIPKRRWHSYEALVVNVPENQQKVFSGEILLSDFKESNYAVISDIDDTFLISHSKNTLKKVELMFFRNALTRKAFEGITALYQAFNIGQDEKGFNPLFYVSSSEWNLYDLLDEFCTYNDIPKGAFLLREMYTKGYRFWKSGKGNHNHKLDKIHKIITTYPDMKFILVGDSGQADTKIYSEIVNEYKDRILMIYIRNVSSKRRIKKLEKYCNENKVSESQIFFGRRSLDLAKHAYNNGLISKHQFENVEQKSITLDLK